mmetsp:Transcript_25242/g.55525  ORF Transcript_25242/g.55525 Transcript_25242/m.55525 type:complete len:316 (-) Transcript_25242:576-1523(-)
MPGGPGRLPTLPLLPHHRREGRHAVGLLLLRGKGPLEFDIGKGLHFGLADGISLGLLAALELLHSRDRMPLFAQGLVLLHLADTLEASQGFPGWDQLVGVICRLVVISRCLINHNLPSSIHGNSVGQVGGGLYLSALGFLGGAHDRLGRSWRSEIQHLLTLGDHGSCGLFALRFLAHPPLDRLPRHKAVVVTLGINALLAVLGLLGSLLFNKVIKSFRLREELPPCLALLHALDIIQQGHVLLGPDIFEHVIGHSPEHLIDALAHKWTEVVGRLCADDTNRSRKNSRQVVVAAHRHQDMQEAEQSFDDLLVRILS